MPYWLSSNYFFELRTLSGDCQAGGMKKTRRLWDGGIHQVVLIGR